MGSVKNLSVVEEPTESKSGFGLFEFSDRYSVFDWGEMPDHIPNKGSSLAIITSHFFEILRKRAIPNHYLGVVVDGGTFDFNKIDKPFNTIKVKLVRVIKPEIKNKLYDYSVYKNISKNFLVPMECIYRNSVPEGSSFWERYNKGEIKYEYDITPNVPLERPILDVSTKLEETDRYMSWDEAKKISNLDSDQIEEIKSLLSNVSNIITEETKRVGIINQDGKLEFAIDDKGFIMVVDALGTLDECRFLFNEIALSKEILRKHYRKSKWYKEVKKAKDKNVKDWKSLVKIKPEPLPKDLKKAVSGMYQSVANLISGKDFFDVPSLDKIVKKLSKLVD
ncbi:phosphoribosylaminoimidazolesuccinocarboxamide synthase [candidate division WOR-3 bacterium]|nr:phosphoribosylaminoimidazolesuccinocarboxamide synthase [candidate division WOR-3 bacterium]